jgi:hypothetical protein
VNNKAQKKRQHQAVGNRGQDEKQKAQRNAGGGENLFEIKNYPVLFVGQKYPGKKKEREGETVLGEFEHQVKYRGVKDRDCGGGDFIQRHSAAKGDDEQAEIDKGDAKGRKNLDA